MHGLGDRQVAGEQGRVPHELEEIGHRHLHPARRNPAVAQ
jgi:hypothetical protein